MVLYSQIDEGSPGDIAIEKRWKTKTRPTKGRVGEKSVALDGVTSHPGNRASVACQAG